MMDLPPLVSKGSPIRAADQNKLINAVRHLSAGSVARSGGANMMRSRVAGKKLPFEVTVYWDASRGGVVVRAEPGIWHGTGDPQSVPAGIIESADEDTWILPGDKDESTGEYLPFEQFVGAASGSGRVIIKGRLTGGKISGASIEWTTSANAKNDISSGSVEHTVASVDFTVENSALKSSTVVRHLNGDFWMNSIGGAGGESWAGNPFAWTKVGDNKWQLRRAVLMATPNQVYGTSGESGVNVMIDTAGDVYDPVREDSVVGYDTYPHTPNYYGVIDGLCVSADLSDGDSVLIYAEVDGGYNVDWRVRALPYSGSEGVFPLPWVPQRCLAALTFDVSRQIAGNAYDLQFRLRGDFDDGEDLVQKDRFRVSIPMAIISRLAGKTTLVPIRQGMIEVRPALAIGFRMYSSTEFAYTAIDSNYARGTWNEPSIRREEFVEE